MTDMLTFCPYCSVVCPLDGTYGLAPHLLRWHPGSPLANQIRLELNRQTHRQTLRHCV